MNKIEYDNRVKEVIRKMDALLIPYMKEDSLNAVNVMPSLSWLSWLYLDSDHVASKEDIADLVEIENFINDVVKDLENR